LPWVGNEPSRFPEQSLSDSLADTTHRLDTGLAASKQLIIDNTAANGSSEDFGFSFQVSSDPKEPPDPKVKERYQAVRFYLINGYLDSGSRDVSRVQIDLNCSRHCDCKGQEGYDVDLSDYDAVGGQEQTLHFGTAIRHITCAKLTQAADQHWSIIANTSEERRLDFNFNNVQFTQRDDGLIAEFGADGSVGGSDMPVRNPDPW
jgi:hypothetical protein